MKKMRKNQIFSLVLLILLAYRARSVTVDEVESVKREFDKEVKALEGQAELKKLKDSNSKKDNDLAVQEVVSDLLKHGIENSLNTLNKDAEAKAEEDREELKSLKDSNSKKANDPAIHEVVNDLIQHGIENSMKKLTNDADVDQEKAAFELLTELTKDEKMDENAFKREAMKQLEKLERKEAGKKRRKGKCKDRLGTKECKLRIRACDVPLLKVKMRYLCEASCGYCKNCEDVWPSAYCKFASKRCKKRRLKKDCEDTCRHCNKCEDNWPTGYCKIIAKHCKVPKQNQRMKKNCKATCGYCDKCEDTWPRDYCRAISNQCKVPTQRRRMKKNCKATCGYCKSKFPPACQNSPFGCCWDNVTKKNDKHGLNCPVCADKHIKLCKKLTGFCSNSKFMKQNCPRSCGFCRECENSKDKVSYEALCQSWLKKNFCNVLDIRFEYCKYTCNCVWPESLPDSEYVPITGK